ncbi:PepSY-associated TM helix domain-containing protein [Aliarcobacter vitoriensis]|uniref:PepSY-associated TM helix domain-containing protein n=1 Tax=Aliarcobacter vitoriensis TaxID=2011099 RepID=UPI003AAB5C86
MNTEQLCKHEDEKLLKQRLQRVHIITGITFSLLMYISVFFGIFAILLPYIQAWEKPSRHFKTVDSTNIDYGKMIDKVLAEPDYPLINGVHISLPGYWHDPALRIFAEFTKERVFNPNTNQEVFNEDKQSELSWFLNTMHYGKPFKDFGLYTFGFMAVGVMFLVIGGVYLIIKIKYSNNAKTPTSKFSKYHRKIFIWTFTPLIIIILTGALFNIGYSGSVPMTFLSSKGETTNIYKLTDPILFPNKLEYKENGKISLMFPINELLKKAKDIAPQIDFQRIHIMNWNTENGIAKFEGYNPYMPFLNGITNKPSVTLSGLDGSLIDKQDVLDRHWSSIFFDGILFLHFLVGVDTFTRLVVLSLMILTTLAIGFGNLLYLEKKARKFGDNIPVYQGFGKLSLAVMIGVIPATGLLFVLQWILPFDMENRFLIQKGLFAVCWVATLTWSFYRINSYQASKEFLYLGGVLFALSPIIHFIFSGFSPIRLWNEEIYTVLAVDIGLFIFGLILLYVAKKLPTDRQKIQEFWSKRL